MRNNPSTALTVITCPVNPVTITEIKIVFFLTVVRFWHLKFVAHRFPSLNLLHQSCAITSPRTRRQASAAGIQWTHSEQWCGPRTGREGGTMVIERLRCRL